MRLIVLFLSLFSWLAAAHAQTLYSIVQKDSNGIVLEGLINAKGNVIIPVHFESIYYGFDGNIVVKSEGKWGCYNLQGVQVIPFEYERIAPNVYDTILKAEKNDRYGFISNSNKVIIPFQYTEACNFQNGKAFVNLGNSKFYIDKNGNKIQADDGKTDYCEEDFVAPLILLNKFEDSILAIFQIGGKLGVRRLKDNKTIIPAIYEEIDGYNSEMINVRKGKLWGCYSESGVLMVEPRYHNIGVWFEL